jgi:hypothetical protein
MFYCLQIHESFSDIGPIWKPLLAHKISQLYISYVLFFTLKPQLVSVTVRAVS